MSRAARVLLALMLAVAGALHAGPADVVVLKGGARVELKKPAERRGDLVLLTRADGTLLSVPFSEIDWKATADLRAARAPGKAAPDTSVTAPADSPAQAARQGKAGPHAKVKLTDSDVQHPAEEERGFGGQGEEAAGAGGRRAARGRRLHARRSRVPTSSCGERFATSGALPP